jgi:hypothetical protein
MPHLAIFIVSDITNKDGNYNWLECKSQPASKKELGKLLGGKIEEIPCYRSPPICTAFAVEQSSSQSNKLPNHLANALIYLGFMLPENGLRGNVVCVLNAQKDTLEQTLLIENAVKKYKENKKEIIQALPLDTSQKKRKSTI